MYDIQQNEKSFTSFLTSKTQTMNSLKNNVKLKTTLRES